jgi:transposase
MRGAAPAHRAIGEDDMTSIPHTGRPRESRKPAVSDRVVYGGVDTHKELHVAAVVDGADAVLGTRSFSTTRAGYRALLSWIGEYGQLVRIGVEGTGSYGAGLARHLAKAGVTVLEVDRPDRSDRRRKGKDDDLDAINAARAALHNRRTTIPKSKDGAVEALRVLRTARAQAVRERRNALQLLRMTIVAAPDEVRDHVRNLTRMQLIRVVAAWRPDVSNVADPVTAYRVGLKSLARRYLELTDEITDLDELINPLVEALAPQLLARLGIGIEIAGQMLVTAGDNPDRMKSEAGFAMLCGVAPLPASSGMTQRHRLNRGGDRQANRALHLAVVSRIRMDPKTQAYVARKTAEGHSKLEIIRCLKRYLAREVYYLLHPGQQHIARRPYRRSAPRPHFPVGSSIAATTAGAQARSRWSTPTG